ncbi:MAG: alpha-galactosidase [Anaerolineaceae bacterium]|nr:alpha-galactosidase [Anaerolineaceae bacterium]
MEFETKDFSLSISSLSGILTLRSRNFPETSFQTRLNTTVEFLGKEQALLAKSWAILETEEPTIQEVPAGPMRLITFRLATALKGVQLVVRCGLSMADPMAFLQLELVNASEKELVLKKMDLLDIPAGQLHLGKVNPSDPVFYSNGWQSWSSTGSYGLGDQQNKSMLGRFQNPMVVNPGTPQPKKRNTFTGDLVGLVGDKKSKIGLVAGFLSQKAQFGSLEATFNPEPSLKVWANGDQIRVKPGSNVQTDWLALSFVNLADPDPLGPYLATVGRLHDVAQDESVPVGWCSWYHFYQDIDEKVLDANLDTVITLNPELPLELFQIDDGFETYPGDWYDFVSGFPNGLKPLVEKTKEAGLIPGVWLAPFIVHPKARLVSEHPDWLLRDAEGKPVTAGFVWNSFTFALDLTNPEALAYTQDVIRTAVQDWGFTYLKLDFLYAAALDGVYQDATLSRAQVLRMGLEALREAAGPQITMLGCGCPLGSGLGIFEAMRISADVSGYWKPHFPPVSGILQNEPHMPSARNAIHNILTRAPLHRRWWVNDPDCLLVRPDTKLSLAEVQTLTTAIGLTGGSLLVSDDLPALPKDRLAIAQALLPVIGKRARVLDLFETDFPGMLRVDLEGPEGPWHLLAKFNWEVVPKDLTFTSEEYQLDANQSYWLREFWSGQLGLLKLDRPLTFAKVPAHGVAVVAARAFDPQKPAYLGSNLHLAQGLEISGWRNDEKELSIEFALGRKAAGEVFLSLPWQPTSAQCNENPCPFEDLGDGIYTLHLTDADQNKLKVFH